MWGARGGAGGAGGGRTTTALHALHGNFFVRVIGGGGGAHKRRVVGCNKSRDTGRRRVGEAGERRGHLVDDAMVEEEGESEEACDGEGRPVGAPWGRHRCSGREAVIALNDHYMSARAGIRVAEEMNIACARERAHVCMCTCELAI